jgi:hypothetical protein
MRAELGDTHCDRRHEIGLGSHALLLRAHGSILPCPTSRFRELRTRSAAHFCGTQMRKKRPFLLGFPAYPRA